MKSGVKRQLVDPETETSSTYWAQLDSFHPKTEREFSLRNTEY
jgi:hypothetical protein